MPDQSRAVILDLDGTLVDSNYQHTIGWQRAFRACGHQVAAWRIHRLTGMGGDQLVRNLIGEKGDQQVGDDVREAEGEAYAALMPEVKPFDGAADLIRDLKTAGSTVVLASSAKEAEVQHYIGLLGVRDEFDGYTSSGDVDSTKPEPDLIEVALQKAETDDALMVGDSVWDVEAAKRAGLETIAVLCGGFGEDELAGAGASLVVESVDQVAAEIIRS